MARTPPRRPTSKLSGSAAAKPSRARKPSRGKPGHTGRKGARKGKAPAPVTKSKTGKVTRPSRGSNKRSPRAKQPAVAAPILAENPRALALAHTIANLALDKKALDVLILDVRGKTSYADYVVIASGESDRQVGATAEAIRAEIKGTQGLSPIGSEGFETGNWVLLDYGEVVVHLFLQEIRAFYDLEGLWADAAREKVA